MDESSFSLGVCVRHSCLVDSHKSGLCSDGDRVLVIEKPVGIASNVFTQMLTAVVYFSLVDVIVRSHVLVAECVCKLEVLSYLVA